MKEIIHVYHLESVETALKYATEFFEFIYSEPVLFKDVSHSFYFKFSEREKYKEKIEDLFSQYSFDIKVCFFKTYSELVKVLLKNTEAKVVFHQLADPKLYLYLYWNKSVLSRSAWMVWGGDLYQYIEYKISLKTLKYKLFDIVVRKSVIRKLANIISIEDDFDVAASFYKSEASHLLGIYPHRLYSNDTRASRTSAQRLPTIMVGHSASPINKHEEMFDILANKYMENFRVLCPLSYGDSVNAKKVKEKGQELFGDNFESLDSFLSEEEYIHIISSVDVAVFNCKRQASIGNLALLIALKKKVYFHSTSVPYQFYSKNNIRLENSQNISKISIDELLSVNETTLERNEQAIRELYSNCSVSSMWKEVFDKC